MNSTPERCERRFQEDDLNNSLFNQKPVDTLNSDQIQVTMSLSTEGSFFTERAIEWKGHGRTTGFANILQGLLNNLILKSI